jgi:PAS domain S-box-containing protein
LMDAMPVPVYYKDTQGHYIGANKAFKKFYGISEQEMLGKTAFDITSKPLAEFFIAKDMELLQNPGQQVFETRMLDYNQAPHEVIFYKSTFANVDGETIGIIGVIQDISDRKAAEQAMLEATNEVEHFFSSALDLLCIADTDGYFRRLNPEWEKVLGYRIDELEGHRFLDFVHPDDFQSTQDAMAKLRSKVDVIDFNNRYRCKDGSYRWIEWRSKFVENKIYAAARDITDRINADKALRESEERYRNFVANASEGIFRTDFTQPIKIDQPYEDLVEQCTRFAIVGEVNMAFSAMYGLKPSQMVGRPYRDFSPTCGAQIADITKSKDYRIKEREEIDYTVDGKPINILESYFGIVEEGILKRVWGVQQDITERKKVENALRRNEGMLSSLLAAAPVGVALLKERVILKVNNALCRITGYSEEELLGNTTRIFYPDEHEFNRVGTELYAKMEKTGLGSGEARLKRKDGENIDVIISLSPFDANDLSKGVTATVLDITERKQVENILRENEAFISSLFAATPAGVGFLKDRVILKANNAMYKITGFTEQEILGKTTRQLYPDDEEYERVGQELYAEMDREGLGIGEACFRRKNGEIIDVLLCLNAMDPSDKSKGVTVTVLDITDRKEVERALRESEKKYRSVIENIQDVFYRADLNGNLLMGSPSGARMFGYDSVEEMIGMPLIKLWANPLDRSRMMEQVQNMNSLKDFEAILKRKDGSTFFASFTTHLYYDDNGNLLGTEGIIRDITGRKKAEEEIRLLNEVLEQRVRVRTQQLETAVQELEAFSYSVSHDLRAPLRAINGYAHILTDDYSPKLDKEGKRVCSIISKETKRMSCLIDELLAFARLGRVELQSYVINMDTLVNSVFQELTTPTERQSISFEVSPLEMAFGDPSLLRQVWVNLISNAIKFSSYKEQRIIQISSHQKENEIIYSVKDNGAGFDMRYAQNLFGVFNRMHSEKEFEGTGVGLAIVQRIINRHGGHVWGEGDVDNGATFHFSLPKRESAL